MRISSVVFFLILGLFLGACAPKAPEMRDPVGVHEMEPLVFEVKTDSEDPEAKPEVQMRDPVEEYNLGSEAMDKGRYREAAELFRGVAKLVPGTERAHVAGFNAGLCWEYAKKHSEAAIEYKAVLITARNDVEDTKIRFRLASVLEISEQWPELFESLQPLDTRELIPPDKMSVLTRVGTALVEMERYDEAEAWLERAVAFWDEHQDIALIRTGAHIAQAQFSLARVFEHRFKEQKLQLPIDQMEKDLMAKWRLLVVAQNQCLEVVHRGSVRYGLAAGLKVGKLYELFYDSLMEAEVPPELDDEQREVYFDELRKKIRPYLFEAFEIYRTNLRVAMQKGHRGGVLLATKKAMDKLRKRIEADLQEDLRGPPDFTYRARLGKADHKDHRGRVLKSAISIILRDRENFHVYKVRDDGDTEEPRFDDVHERDWYKKLLKENLGKEEAKMIRKGTPFIEVRVWRDEVDVSIISR